MTDADRALGAVHARTVAYQRRLDETHRLIARGLACAPGAYVSFSGGKDSAVCLHVARTVAPVRARILLWTESAYLDDYTRILAWWASRGVPVDVVTMHRARLDDRVAERWRVLGTWAPTDGYIIGLRAEESRARAITLRHRGPVFQRPDGTWRIAPVAWWTTRDVIAYHVTHDLPVLDAYAHEGMAARTATRVPRDAYGIREASLARLRQRDLARWNALVTAYPEAAEFC